MKTNYARNMQATKGQVKQVKHVTTNEQRRQKRKMHDKLIVGIIVALVGLLIVLTGQVMAKSEHEVQAPLTKEAFVQSIEKTDVVEKETPKATDVKKANETKVEKAQPVAEATGVYNPEIPMPMEHQEFLYDLCQAQGLNYKTALAVIQHESMFDVNATNATNDFGYFQINQVNHAPLAEELNTANSPFDPYVNMQWGTHMLSELYDYWADRGYHGQGLDDAVFSSYNKGKTGFLQTGHAVAYVNKMKASIQTIESKF